MLQTIARQGVALFSPALTLRSRRWLLNVTLMLATMMQVLDSTIANVALPHIQGSLGATPDSVAWVLTSYILMTAITMPITGWLEQRIGRRNLYLVSIIGFTVSSLLCGISGSLEMIVIARALQGMFGAFISPLAQASMLDNNPREKHPQILMIWSMVVMVAPIIGPLLGGWLTDNYGWPWVFLINLPLGALATLGIWLLLSKTPPIRRQFDLMGFGLIALALASFQLMLDRGTQQDWFESTEIVIEAGVAASAVWMLIFHLQSTRSPIFSAALFRDRNIVVASLMNFILSGLLMAGAALSAPMMQGLLGYDAMGAGIISSPRGIGVLLAMPMATFLGSRVDSRALVIFGMLMVVGSLWMLTGINLQMGAQLLVVSSLLQGVGLAFATMPMNLLAFATLAPALRTEGAVVFNLARNIGSSITIAVASALLARNLQVSHSDLAAHVTGLTLPGMLIEKAGSSSPMIAAVIDAEINRQALMIAYIDDFWLMKWLALLIIPLVLLMRGSVKTGSAPPVHLE